MEEPEAVQVELKAPISGQSLPFTHDNQPLAGFLNATGGRTGDATKLDAIADFFRGDEKEFTDIDLLQAVRHIESRLGTPELNERRIDRIFRYVTLQHQIDNLGKERDVLLK